MIPLAIAMVCALTAVGGFAYLAIKKTETASELRSEICAAQLEIGQYKLSAERMSKLVSSLELTLSEYLNAHGNSDLSPGDVDTRVLRIHQEWRNSIGPDGTTGLPDDQAPSPPATLSSPDGPDV